MTAGDLTVAPIRFPAREARMVRVARDTAASAAVAALGLPVGRPVIVVNGGTGELTSAAADGLRGAMAAVATLAVEDGATLVTGATDAGVFSLLGEALGQTDGDYVCLGVAPAGLTTWPGKPTDTDAAAEPAVPLEGHHTHFVLVEARRWGEETPVMMGVVSALGSGTRAVAVLAGGGAVAAQELRAHLAARRPVVVLAGSGRLADRVVGLVRGSRPADRELAEVAGCGDLLEVCDPTLGAAALERALRRRLGGA